MRGDGSSYERQIGCARKQSTAAKRGSTGCGAVPQEIPVSGTTGLLDQELRRARDPDAAGGAIPGRGFLDWWETEFGRSLSGLPSSRCGSATKARAGHAAVVAVGDAAADLVNGRVKILESYLAPTSFALDGAQIRKGTWLLAVRVLDDKLWTQIKNGELTGLSMGGSAARLPEPAARSARFKAESPRGGQAQQLALRRRLQRWRR